MRSRPHCVVDHTHSARIAGLPAARIRDVSLRCVPSLLAGVAVAAMALRGGTAVADPRPPRVGGTITHVGQSIYWDTSHCGQPWIAALEDSEDAYVIDNAGLTPAPTAYTSAQQEAFYDRWLSNYLGSPCPGGGQWRNPMIPPLLPPGTAPFVPPDRGEPICAGLPCVTDPPLARPPQAEPGPPMCAGIACGDLFGPMPPPAQGTPVGPPMCAGMQGPCGLGYQEQLVTPPPKGPPACAGIGCTYKDFDPPPLPGPGKEELWCAGGSCDFKQFIPGLPKQDADGPKPGDFWAGISPAPGTGCMWGSLGPAAPMATSNPVDLAYGHKLDATADLIVPVTGRDFVLSRSYTSKPDMGGSELVGVNWSLNAFTFLEKTTSGATAPLRVSTSSGGARTFVHDATSQNWYPPGPSSQYIVKTSLNVGTATWPVYRLVEPGAWDVNFIRENESGESGSSGSGTTWQAVPATHPGLVLQEREVYVANFKHFTYSIPNAGAGSLEVARLDEIFLNGTSAGTCEASLKFLWNDINNANLGRLREVQVLRPASPSPELVQYVQYTYKLAGDGNSADTGSDGDLIQVVTWTKVDRYPAGHDDGPWYPTVVQYRYHMAWANRETSTDTDGDGYIEQGNLHQLKSVFMPEQVEHAAQRYYDLGDPDSNFDNNSSAAFATDVLLTLDDDGTAYTDGSAVAVVKLAGKVIDQYEQWTGSSGGRVLRQHLLSGCGCGGGAGSQGVRYEYTYHSISGTSGQGRYARTLEVVESTLGSGGWAPNTTTWYDLAEFTESGDSYYLLVNHAIEDPATSLVWVTHVEYDTGNSEIALKRRIVGLYPPAAALNYEHTWSGSEPDWDPKTSDASYRKFEYTLPTAPDTTTRLVREFIVALPNSSSLYSETTYDSTRPWLPVKVEIARAEGVSSPGSASADDIQTIEFRYAFHSGTDAVQLIETEFEGETVAENGDGSALFVHSFYDTRGRNHWTRQADGSLVRRTFDGTTGNLALLENNAAKPGSGFPSTTVSGSSFSGSFDGHRTDGGSMTWTYTYDSLGRSRTVLQPTGVKLRYARETREFVELAVPSTDGRPGLPYFSVVSLPPVEPSTPLFAGYAGVHWKSAAGTWIGGMDYPMSNAVDDYGAIFNDGYDYSLDTTAPQSRSTVQQNLAGQTTSSTVWHAIDGTGDEGGHYITTYEHDKLGRLVKTTSPNGAVAAQVLDALGRVTAQEVGTAAATATVAKFWYDFSGTGSPAHEVGNGNVTLVEQFTGEASGTEVRSTVITFDVRDRPIKVESPLAPHHMSEYDNLGRVVKSASFLTLPSGTDLDASGSLADRLSYTETAYSQRGLVHRTRIAIDPHDSSPGSGDGFLESHTWHDANGRIVATWGPDGPGRKVQYNHLGQPTAVFVTDRGGDPVASPADPLGDYSDALDVVGDIVYEQVNVGWQTVNSDPTTATGLVDMVTARSLLDGQQGSATGDLASQGSKTVSTYAATIYDVFGRPVKQLDYGTNASSPADFVANTSAPTRSGSSGNPYSFSDTSRTIVSELLYDDKGRVDQMVAWNDTAGSDVNRTKLVYDAMDRQIGVIENFQAGSGAGLSWNGSRWEAADIAVSTENRTTSISHHVGLNCVDRSAHLWTGTAETAQTTRYQYGVTASASGSLVTSADLLLEVQYPDPASGDPDPTDDKIVYGYNILGELRYVLDQNGVTHTYARDGLGRVTEDLASLVFGGNGNIDLSTIDRIVATYNVSATPPSVTLESKLVSTVKNAVKVTFTPLWQPAQFYQDPDGPITVDGSGVPQGNTRRVVYSYDTDAFRDWSASAGGNWSRLSQTTYPSGHQLEPLYELTSSPHPPDWFVGRARGLEFDGSNVVEYAFLGFGEPIRVDYPQPDVRLDRALAHSGSRSTSGYPGLDRWGRLVRHEWADGAIAAGTGSGAGVPTIPPIVELAYERDRYGNLTNKYDYRPGAARELDQDYTHDDLFRLTLARRGKGPSGSFADGVGGQQFELDSIGNFVEFDTDLDGNASYTSADQLIDGTFTMVNAIVDLVKTQSGGSPVTLPFAYDAAGNLEERTLATGSGGPQYQFKHDAWNRLVQVSYYAGSGTPIVRAEHRYNAMHMRVRKDSDPGLTNTLTERRVFYYDLGWRILEEHVDVEATLSEITGSGSDSDTDRVVQNVWGLRYVDDPVLRRQNNNYAHGGDTDFTDAGDRRGDYLLTDHQFSVVAVVDTAGSLQERTSYDAYGWARHHWKADVNGDGRVDISGSGTDLDIANNALNQRIYQAGYNVDADINRDGRVTTADTALITAKAALADGQVSDPTTVDGTAGFCSYQFNREWLGYTVRFRHYDPAPGVARWLERDPAGYVDGSGLYGYGTQAPTQGGDPLGLDYDWHHIVPWALREELGKYLEGGINAADNGLILSRGQHIRLHNHVMQAVSDRKSVTYVEWWRRFYQDIIQPLEQANASNGAISAKIAEAINFIKLQSAWKPFFEIGHAARWSHSAWRAGRFSVRFASMSLGGAVTFVTVFSPLFLVGDVWAGIDITKQIMDPISEADFQAWEENRKWKEGVRDRILDIGQHRSADSYLEEVIGKGNYGSVKVKGNCP